MTSAVRADVRSHINKEEGFESSGGDFHVPFWRDAKDHLQGTSDLTEQTHARIGSNSRRSRLYPELAKKFLEWWNEKKRWSNEGFSILPNPIKGQFKIPELKAIVKVENILPIDIGNQPTRYFYPYFSESPILGDEAARIGLWLIQQALPNIPADRIRILDILRAKSFSLKKNPLKGNEEELFIQSYGRILRKWDEIYAELKNED